MQRSGLALTCACQRSVQRATRGAPSARARLRTRRRSRWRHRPRRAGRAPRRRPRPRRALSAPQQRYLALAQAGVAARQSSAGATRGAAGMTRGWTTANAIRWPRSGTSCRCSSRSTRSRSPQPTRRQPARRRALRRGRRALPEPRPAPGARLLALPRRPRSQHRDVVRRQRLVGPGVRERLPRDRHAPLADRRRTGARATSPPPAGTRRRRDLVEHRAPLQGRRGARRRTRCWRRCSTSRPLAVRARAGAEVPRLGQHAPASAAPNGLYAGSSVNPTPIDYIEAPLIYAQALLCRLTGARRRLRTRRAAEGHGAAALRLPARLLAAVRRDLPAVDARAVLARRRPARCTRSPPTTRATHRRARSTAKGSTCSPGTAKRCPPPTRCRGCCRRRPPPPACSPGWRCTRRQA